MASADELAIVDASAAATKRISYANLAGSRLDALESAHLFAYGSGIDSTGASSSTTALQAKIDTLTALPTGGALVFPPGTFLCNLVAKPKVRLACAGIGKTVLKAPNGSNADVIKGLNFATLTGKTKAAGDYALGAYEFGLENVTIDGNKDNNTTGFGVRIWGRAPIFHNVEIRNASEDGLWTEFTEVDDFADPVQVLEGKISGDFFIHDCDGDGWTHRGPHDTMVDSYAAWSNGGLGLRVEAGALDGTAYNGGVFFNYFNAFLNTGGSIYYNGSALEIRGGQIVADSSQIGLEVAATAAGNMDINAIFAGSAAGTNTGLYLRGSSHRIRGSVLRLGTGIKIDGAINCDIDVTGSGNTTFLNIVGAETGPNFISALMDVPASGALKAGSAFNGGGHYMMRGYGSGGNFYVQQFPSQTLMAGGWSPVLPNSNGVLLTGDLATFTAQAAAGVPNNSLFRDSADGKLKYKDNSAVVNALY